MAQHSTTLTGSQIVTLLSGPGVPVVTNHLTKLADVTLEAPHGISGTLYHGECDGSEVAMRIIRLHIASNNTTYATLKVAANELKLWFQLRHEHVVPLVGLACIQGQAALVSPWAHNGRIFHFLHKHPSANRFQLVERSHTDSLTDIDKLVHSNIQADNVLVSQNGNVKLVGLGTSVLKDLGHHGDGINESNLRLRWTAPEIFDSRNTYHTASDVWALGMTILEVFTKLHPFAKVKADRDVISQVVGRKIPSRPAEIDGQDHLWALLVHCWQYDPKKRPSAAAVFDALRRMG